MTGSRWKNAPGLEVGTQTLEDDNVWGDDQERPGVVVAALGHSVEILPGDDQAHHLGLAAPSGHFDAVAGEVVVLQQLQVLPAGESLQQALLPPHPRHLIQVDERFDGVLLRVVVGEAAAVGQTVMGVEPPVEQAPRCVRRAAVAVAPPGLDPLAQGRDARGRRGLRIEQRQPCRGVRLFAAHDVTRPSLRAVSSSWCRCPVCRSPSP